MRILKYLSKFLICVLCVISLCAPIHAEEGNIGDVGDYGSWLTGDNVDQINEDMSHDATEFQRDFANEIRQTGFVPIEAKIGLVFMKALSSIDYVLQISLVRFTIIFLFVMYGLWVAFEAYKMIRDSNDYKKVLYDIFEKGFIVAIWVLILDYGPAKIFTMLISPILNLCSYLSSFIMDAIADSAHITKYDTCTAIHNFVNTNAPTNTVNGTAKLLIDADTAANIMCLPGRLSVYFYHAIGTAFKWFLWGFGNSITAIVMGAICIAIFVKCIFRYAFMTLGIIADLFLTLLMLPFTALAEALPPSTKNEGYIGQIFNGFLSIFNTKKVSDVISVFINTGIYFISLAIIISICAALLGNIIPLSKDYSTYHSSSAIAVILCGCLVLYLADHAEDLAKKIGGSVDNSFGVKLQQETKTFWGDTKNVAGKIFKDWLKK